MARAYNVYIVQNRREAILAAFTVKHECLSWLEEREKRFNGWRVSCFRDGWTPEQGDLSTTADKFLTSDGKFTD